jgi:hypothetical protein
MARGLYPTFRQRTGKKVARGSSPLFSWLTLDQGNEVTKKSSKSIENFIFYQRRNGLGRALE